MYKFKLIPLFVFVFSLNTSFAQDEITEGLKDIFGGVGKVIGGSLGILGGYQPPQQARDQKKMSGSCVNGSTNNFRYTDGSEYVGGCNGDNRVGHGTLTWVTGTTYIGDWVNNVRHGQGQQRYLLNGNQTGVYNGDFLNDKQYGKGTIKFSSGETYAGDWVDNKRHGFGKAYVNLANFGMVNYQGDYDKDNAINGIIDYGNGSKYIGEMNDGLKHGVGKYTDQYGNTYIGQWKDDKKDGMGVYITASGQKSSGVYKGGRLINADVDVNPDTFNIKYDQKAVSSTTQEGDTTTNTQDNNTASSESTGYSGYNSSFKMPEITLSQEFINNFWKFILIFLPILSYLVLIYFSTKKTYTVFTSAGDIISTLFAFILPVVVIWFMTYIGISTGFDMTAFITGTIIFLLYSSSVVKTSIKRNEDKKMGAIIGVTKIFASLVILVFSLGLFNALFGNNNGKNESAGGNLAMLLLVTSVLYFFIKLLITGDKTKNPQLTEKPS